MSRRIWIISWSFLWQPCSKLLENWSVLRIPNSETCFSFRPNLAHSINPAKIQLTWWTSLKKKKVMELNIQPLMYFNPKTQHFFWSLWTHWGENCYTWYGLGNTSSFLKIYQFTTSNMQHVCPQYHWLHPWIYPKTNGCWRNEDVCVVSYHFYDDVYWNQPTTGITNSRTPSHPTVALCKGFTYMSNLFPGPHHFLLHHTRVSHLRPHLFDATQWPYLAPTACTLCRSVVKPGILWTKNIKWRRWANLLTKSCWQSIETLVG